MPTQRECLQLLSCAVSAKFDRFAEIQAAKQWAVETSICAALDHRRFVVAHDRKRRGDAAPGI
jgi:hypothetical protein